LTGVLDYRVQGNSEPLERRRIMRLAHRIKPPADPETLELVATGDPLDILESAEACRVASMIAALLANGEGE